MSPTEIFTSLSADVIGQESTLRYVSVAIFKHIQGEPFGNLMLIVLNLPMIGLWVSLLRVPYRLMFPAIVLFCCIGTYSINNSTFDVWLMLMFGLVGVFLIKVGAEPAPFVLGFILGPLMEENFRRAMNLSRGDPSIFVQRPISALLLALSLALLVILILPAVRAKREEVFQE